MLAVDLLCRNDSLRALDVLLQHRKSLELEMLTGSWREGQALELVPAEDLGAYSRQELKPVQDENKAVHKLTKGGGKYWQGY